MVKDRVNVMIDGGGTVISLCGLCALLWFGLLKHNSAADELHDLRYQQIDMQSEYSKMQRVVQHNIQEYESLKEQAVREGKLDQRLPIEERLKRLRAMATNHGWSNLHLSLVSWQSVADVAEHTFSVAAEARFDSLVGLLQEFEHSASWADISHVVVTPIEPTEDNPQELCAIEFTIHFYASYTEQDLST